MYTTFDVDKVAEIISSHSSVTDSVVEQSQYLFTIKMVLGENLVNPDGGSRAKLDPFLILSNPQGDRVAKTRTLYETNDPRWEETVDVSVHGDLWIRATIYNRNLVDHHDVVALAYLHLNPADFGDFLTRDIWLQLEDVRGNKLEGRLLLRISMEGEKDDIQFYFGRAFRSLKRAENDMTRTIVDKVSAICWTLDFANFVFVDVALHPTLSLAQQPQYSHQAWIQLRHRSRPGTRRFQQGLRKVQRVRSRRDQSELQPRHPSRQRILRLPHVARSWFRKAEGSGTVDGSRNRKCDWRFIRLL